MSEPAAKRPMIDLDEFERRLRRPTPAAAHSHEDPLAELARLVGGGQEDPFKTVFEQDRRLPRSPRLATGPVGTSRPVPVEQPYAQEDFAAQDYAAHDQHLHGTIHPQAYADQQHYAEEPYAEQQAAMTAVQPAYQQTPAEEQDYAWSEIEAPVPQRSAIADAPRSRRPLYVMAAIIAAGIAGIGVSFAYKAKSGPHELATIKAMSGPTKVQPDSPGGADVANQDASILDKTPQPTPVALVDHQERPVDLAHQPAGAIAPRTIMADAAGSMGAASVPVPPPPAGPQGAGAQQNIQSYGIGALIEPKKVKTVSVRSDGTVLPNDTPPQMPSAPQAQMMQPPQHPTAPVASGAATPKPATPKSTQRVVTTPKPESIEQIADENNGAPAAPAAAAPAAPAPAKAKAAPAKPMKVAEAEATDSIPDGADTAHGSSGSFAVQLAAPGTEQEAHEMTNKLASKFGSQLGGHHLTYHRAKVNDKTVFRVRAAGMSREEATGICQKLQANGGSCFVAKD